MNARHGWHLIGAGADEILAAPETVTPEHSGLQAFAGAARGQPS